MNITITDKKVMIDNVELLRIQRRYWVIGKRDIITYRRKGIDVCTKKVVWRNWGKIDTFGCDFKHPNAAWNGWYEKSQEEINNEIIDVAKMLMSIVTHSTRGDLSGCYPELEQVSM